MGVRVVRKIDLPSLTPAYTGTILFLMNTTTQSVESLRAQFVAYARKAGITVKQLTEECRGLNHELSDGEGTSEPTPAEWVGLAHEVVTYRNVRR